MSVSKVVAAAVQAAPVFLDRDATVEKAARLTKEAVAHGAGLVVFPEAFVPTYPDWVWRTTPWADREWYERLYDQSVTVPGPATEALGAAAREGSTYLAIGVSECGGGTLYNTLLFFGPDGSLLGKHRKLMPTGSERTVWGMGDGSTLPVIDTPYGRLSGLTCWENCMPLARFFLYSRGVDIWAAPTLAQGDGWIASMRHVALEGRCYVIGVNPCVHADQIPADFPHRDRIWPAGQGADGWVEPGNSVIVAPTGAILAGPVRHQETILYADVDPAAVHAARRYFDPVGHYHRPDIFQLHIDTRPRAPVVRRDGGPAGPNPSAPEATTGSSG